MKKYDLGNTETTVWNSFSIAKSVTSMLAGAAVADGKIKNVDEPARTYLPELVGTAYDGVTIRQLLTMTSGIKSNEDYTQPDADVHKILDAVADGDRPGFIVRYLAKLPRAHPPGSVWSYVTGDTHVLGAVVSAAVGKNLSDYLSEKIWAPFGMERDASWMLEFRGGLEFAGCCISATLRDYARLGQFMLENGRADGSQVLPETWVKEFDRCFLADEGRVRLCGIRLSVVDARRWRLPGDRGLRSGHLRQSGRSHRRGCA